MENRAGFVEIQPRGEVVGSVLFRNIGTLVSGDLAAPLLGASSLFVEDGLIKEIGTERAADAVVDVRGTTVTPGLWDAHFHPYFGEYTPRAHANETISLTVRAGTTAVVSAGPAHQPGIYLPSANIPNVQAHMTRTGISPDLARDATGTKALAIVTTKAWKRVRPLGMKCYAETVVAETGLTAEDFAEMAEQGVRRIKFLRPVPSIKECEQYCQWAHDNGMLTMTHTGGRKLIKECESIGEAIRVIRPDVSCHINGGPTPPPVDVADWLVDETRCAVDVVSNGNLMLAKHVIERLRDRDELHRVVIGTDTPSANGVNPGGVERMVQILCHLTGFPPEQVLCMASGNTARAFGLPGGLIQPGQPADLVVWDPMDGSVTTDYLECLVYGDCSSPGLVMIDGEITLHGDPRMIDPKRAPTVTRL